MQLKAKKIIDYYAGGLLIFLIKPVVILLGKLLKRDHSPTPQGRIVFLKLVGGGSLVIAFPALLGIRKKFPQARLILVTTPAVRPFAELLGVFDQIVIINDGSFLSLSGTGLWALLKCAFADTVIDLEVYSRLSTLFSLFTMARNRFGFYLENIFWRQNIHTHLVYFNRASGVYLFYEQMAYLVGATPANITECRELLLKGLPLRARQEGGIAVGHACSEFGMERMLKPSEWLRTLQKRAADGRPRRLTFLGSTRDKDAADQIIGELKAAFPTFTITNFCGLFKLEDSLAFIRNADEFWGIDSSLLHFARLLGKRGVSFWGPTSPHTRLKPIADLEEEVHYEKIHCSPCIHVTETPPCRGNNMCIKKLFNRDINVDGKNALFTTWSAG
ncbi:MAG: glycosyltransferase family 9 protein [Elusimicrobia bacterium]|nr:glycosyltransferase family 9 protein [Candidatus Obscuribacterium magneticum]